MFSSYSTLSKIMFISSSSLIISSIKSSMLQLNNMMSIVNNEQLVHEASLVKLFTSLFLNSNITLIQNELIKTKPRLLL
jgi:hypothetical protein